MTDHSKHLQSCRLNIIHSWKKKEKCWRNDLKINKGQGHFIASLRQTWCHLALSEWECLSFSHYERTKIRLHSFRKFQFSHYLMPLEVADTYDPSWQNHLICVSRKKNPDNIHNIVRIGRNPDFDCLQPQNER